MIINQQILQRNVVQEFIRMLISKIKRNTLISSRSPKLRSKFCFLTPTPNNLENILDAAKVNLIIEINLNQMKYL
jgi:hypothetical protein